MNPWETAGTLAGWVVTGLVAIILLLVAIAVLILALALVAAGVIAVVSVVQEISKAIRTGTRPKLGAVLPFRPREPKE